MNLLQPLHAMRISAVALSLFAAALPAHAGGNHYAGLGIGLFELDSGAGKQNTVGGYVQLGHDFLPYLGAEIRIGGSASASNAGEKVRLDWMVAHFLKPYIEVMDGFTLYGLGGFSVNHSSIEPTAGTKLKKTNVSLSFGAGAQAQITDRLAVSVEWVRYAAEADAATRAASFQGLDINGFVGALEYEF